jgi:DNA (cytosine-5)-methyltransferase 1
MKVLEKISLEKIRNDRKNPIVDFDVKDAVITHYLHNNKNGVSHFYKSDAIEYTNEILKNYVSEDYTNYFTESNFQLELFSNENVPFQPIENPKFKFIDLFAGIGVVTWMVPGGREIAV